MIENIDLFPRSKIRTFTELRFKNPKLNLWVRRTRLLAARSIRLIIMIIIITIIISIFVITTITYIIRIIILDKYFVIAS